MSQDAIEVSFLVPCLNEEEHVLGTIERWSRFPGQNGGLAKVVSGFDYAASFSCSLSIA